MYPSMNYPNHLVCRILDSHHPMCRDFKALPVRSVLSLPSNTLLELCEFRSRTNTGHPSLSCQAAVPMDVI